MASFKRPESANARKTLIVMSCMLGFLVLGTSLLAKWTHAVPYAAGTPTVVSPGGQGRLRARARPATSPSSWCSWPRCLILYTGGNTSFNGFPFLANFVAGDRFLPRQLTKRGHRLAFSNGIIVLGIVAIALILVFDAKVNGLVSLYAIGVFTGFTMAGAGMVKHHLDHKENPKWRRGVVINGISGAVSLLVVLIFAFAKFREGAWVIVIVGPLMYWGLIRLHKQYAAEDAILRSGGSGTAGPAKRRHIVLVLVDSYDLARRPRRRVCEDAVAAHPRGPLRHRPRGDQGAQSTMGRDRAGLAAPRHHRVPGPAARESHARARRRDGCRPGH